MKFAISRTQAYVVRELQKIFHAALVSNKGLVFMHNGDLEKVCTEIYNFDNIMAKHIRENKVCSFDLWSECFIVAYDSSEDYCCHGICNFDLFHELCTKLGVQTVLLPYTYDLIRYIHEFNAHENNEVLGCYIESRDSTIEVEDA